MQGFRSGSNNTVIGYNNVSGSGIAGVHNTIVGANVVLPDGTYNNSIVIADGQGNQRITANGSSVGIGVNLTSINSKAVLELSSSSQVFLPPRMTSAQRTSISSPPVGGIVYQTDSPEALWVYTSTGWQQIFSF
jgi:hypothetical protein